MQEWGSAEVGVGVQERGAVVCVVQGREVLLSARVQSRGVL